MQNLCWVQNARYVTFDSFNVLLKTTYKSLEKQKFSSNQLNNSYDAPI